MRQRTTDLQSGGQESPLTVNSESLAENDDQDSPLSPTPTPAAFRQSQHPPPSPPLISVSSSPPITSRLFSSRPCRFAILIVSAYSIFHICGSVSIFASGRESIAQPYDVNSHKILATRVITIFGLESSGTTFLYQTLSMALNASVVIPDLSARAGDDVEIQHISQPWGLFGYSTGEYSTIDVLPPLGCASFYDQGVGSLKSENCKKETGLDPERQYPLRFFVNITSHVAWYRSRGIDCTAIIMTRDYSTHLQGKKKHILWPLFWKRVAVAEDNYAKELIVDAMKTLDGSVSPRGLKELVMTSYETLMFL